MDNIPDDPRPAHVLLTGLGKVSKIHAVYIRRAHGGSQLAPLALLQLLISLTGPLRSWLW